MMDDLALLLRCFDLALDLAEQSKADQRKVAILREIHKEFEEQLSRLPFALD